MKFTDFDLHADILRAVEAAGLETPTPVQAQSIPAGLEGRDVLATAATGTGKTAAFLLPIMSRLIAEPMNRKPGTPAILVLTPTRELASQITRAVRDFGKFIRMSSVEIVGGMPYREQLRRLSRPVEVVVATPGRLLDHMRGGKLDLSQVGALVLDEADRMLDMGFSDDVAEISRACPHKRQTMLFTATLDKRMEALASGLQKEPLRVCIETKLSAPNIDQTLYYADDFRHKRELVNHFAAREDVKKAIIFVATKRDADTLSRELGDAGHLAGALHGDMSQGQRNTTLKRLVDNRLRLLVATDVAARGIDVRDITHVINFDLPRQVEDYVHRIGRTGRAGASGEAISLVGRDDHGLVVRIERFIKKTLPVETVEGMEPKMPLRAAPSRRPGAKRRPGGGGYQGKSRRANSNDNSAGAKTGDNNVRPWTKAKPRKANAGGAPSGQRREAGNGPRREGGNGPRRDGGNGGQRRSQGGESGRKRAS